MKKRANVEIRKEKRERYDSKKIRKETGYKLQTRERELDKASVTKGRTRKKKKWKKRKKEEMERIERNRKTIQKELKVK